MARPRETGTAADWLSDRVIRGLLSIAMARPYAQRIPLMGRLVQRLVAPVAGFDKRIRAGLAHARPDLSPPDVDRICREVADNFGRTVAEIYSGPEFTARVAAADPLTGPGLPLLMERQAAGLPVIGVVGHFGNYLAIPPAFGVRGLGLGAVYRPMDNPYFNAHYLAAMASITDPLFPRDRAGTIALARYVRAGGTATLGFDQYAHNGADLTFFGKSAPTVLGPAELALKYDAPLMPMNAVRQPDGLSFVVQIDAPIPPGPAPQMMQTANDRLEALVRAHMGQWFWVHRRWKPHRPRKADA